MAIIDFLNSKLNSSLQRKFFKIIISAFIFINPLAIMPQVWKVLTTSNIDGVSIFTWCIFAFFQIAMALEGIRVKSASTFWSMLISVLGSITIITVVLIKG